MMHFSYDTSTEALIEFDMKFERPMLLLYAHRTHGPEVWESDRVESIRSHSTLKGDVHSWRGA